MKVISKLFLVALILMAISCTKQEKEAKVFNLNEFLKDVKIDLSKIEITPGDISEDKTIIKNYLNDFGKLATDIDSLIIAYPNSYIFKTIKLQFLSREGNQAVINYTKDLYNKDSLSVTNKYFFALANGGNKAKAMFEKMIQETPEHYLSYTGLAQVLMQQSPDELENAAKLLYLSLLKNPTNEEAYYHLGNIFSRLNKIDDKAKLDGLVLKMDPGSVYALQSLFAYYIEKKENNKAEELLDVFVKNNPATLKNTDFVQFYTELNKFDKAANYVALAKANKELSPYLSFLEAKIFINLGNTNKGMKALTEFKNSGDKNVPYLITDPTFVENLYKNKKYLKLLKEVEGDAPTIGDKAPVLEGMLTDSTAYAPAQMANKVYLIDFWASWCSPCVAEMPHVISVYNQLNEKGFEIIGVNLDKKREDLLNFQAENGMKWSHIFSGEAWADKNVANYKVKGIPATYLVDKKGIIRYKNIRGEEDLKKYTEKLLAE